VKKEQCKAKHVSAKRKKRETVKVLALKRIRKKNQLGNEKVARQEYRLGPRNKGRKSRSKTQPEGGKPGRAGEKALQDRPQKRKTVTDGVFQTECDSSESKCRKKVLLGRERRNKTQKKHRKEYAEDGRGASGRRGIQNRSHYATKNARRPTLTKGIE